MGTAPSRREPEVHVVVVQPREDGNVDPDAIRKAINQEAGGYRSGESTSRAARRKDARSHPHVQDSERDEQTQQQQTRNTAAMGGGGGGSTSSYHNLHHHHRQHQMAQAPHGTVSTAATPGAHDGASTTGSGAVLHSTSTRRADRGKPDRRQQHHQTRKRHQQHGNVNTAATAEANATLSSSSSAFSKPPTTLTDRHQYHHHSMEAADHTPLHQVSDEEYSEEGGGFSTKYHQSQRDPWRQIQLADSSGGTGETPDLTVVSGDNTRTSAETLVSHAHHQGGFLSGTTTATVMEVTTPSGLTPTSPSVITSSPSNHRRRQQRRHDNVTAMRGYSSDTSIEAIRSRAAANTNLNHGGGKGAMLTVSEEPEHNHQHQPHYHNRRDSSQEEHDERLNVGAADTSAGEITSGGGGGGNISVSGAGATSSSSSAAKKSAAAAADFELFRARDGEEYTVYTREDGKRFYVDWEEQKWRYFPTSWYEMGSFVSADQYKPYENAKKNENKITDEDRFGEFIHPTRGKLATYLRQETLNVLYFFDELSGSWLPLPISWERHHPSVTNLISEVQAGCQGWKDAKSIVAMLRQCSYSSEDCINSYNSINDDGVLDYAERGMNDKLKEQLEKKLSLAKAALKQAVESKRNLLNQVDEQQNRIEELEAENERLRETMETRKEEQRRMSMLYRRHSIRGKTISAASLQPTVALLAEDMRTLRSKFTALRTQSVKAIKNCNSLVQKLNSSLAQLLRIYKRQAREINEVTALYRKETLQRKLLYNEVQELRGNIRVFCRCRFDSSGPCMMGFDPEGSISCRTAQGRKKTFDFERVYTPETRQETVFEDTKPTITSCVDGYNVCIIAYGQTGAGKTYTMTGTKEAQGVNIRSMKELFKVCSQREKVKYIMKVSMVEVYNEAVYDLLASPSEGQEKLQIQKKGKDIFVPGLLELEVRSVEEIVMVMNEGEKNRTVASTKMNTNSSRSHLLLMLRIEGYDKVSKATIHGRLTLVDLAGSERISRSEASGIRLVEAAAINKSLSALGQVFAAIRNSALHIPYRNSKLTHLLQPCIGGDSKACMFVNVSPLADNLAETVSSLEFGQNVRQVELGKATKHITRHGN